MSVYGYRRISTPQQNIERQVRNIAATYPAVAHIVREVYTGTAFRRVTAMTSRCTVYSPGIPLCLTVFPHEPQRRGRLCLV